MSDIEKVKKLREITGAGFKDCNLAIKESNGDIEKAIEILRVKGISISVFMKIFYFFSIGHVFEFYIQYVHCFG